jgi:hypothetical protein
MTFTERGLELGAQTLIVKARQDPMGPPDAGHRRA